MLIVGRPERVVGLTKGGSAVSWTLVRVQTKLFDKYLKGSIHILWNLTPSFRLPSRAGIEGGDAFKVIRRGYRA